MMKRFPTIAATLLLALGTAGLAGATEPTLSISDAVAFEPGSGLTTAATFTVTLTGLTAVPVAVSFTTADQTASDSHDYVATERTLTFEPSGRVVQTRSVVVPVLGDGRPEGPETFEGRLSHATGAVIDRVVGTAIIRSKAKGDADEDGRSDIALIVPEEHECFDDPFFKHYNGHIIWGIKETVGLPLIEVEPSFWHVGATGDFDGDGRADVFWQLSVDDCTARPPVTQLLEVQLVLTPWEGGPYEPPSTAGEPPPGPAWVLVGSGDFAGIPSGGDRNPTPPDGRSDLLWHDPSTGNLGIWLSAGADFPQEQRHVIAGPGFTAVPVAVGDLDGDVAPEIVFRDSVSDELTYWKMAGLSPVESGVLDPSHTVHANWLIVGSGDFNGDGFDDLLFFNETESSHRLVIWFMTAGLPGAGPRRITGDFVSPDRLGQPEKQHFSVGGPR